MCFSHSKSQGEVCSAHIWCVQKVCCFIAMCTPITSWSLVFNQIWCSQRIVWSWRCQDLPPKQRIPMDLCRSVKIPYRFSRRRTAHCWSLVSVSRWRFVLAFLTQINQGTMKLQSWALPVQLSLAGVTCKCLCSWHMIHSCKIVTKPFAVCTKVGVPVALASAMTGIHGKAIALTQRYFKCFWSTS